MAQLFLSYSHKDESYREELERHLTMLRRDGLIDAWHDRMIIPGDDLDGSVSAALEAADVVLFLVSADFLYSRYCYDVEARRALERQREGTCSVVPVLLRPCEWKSAPFGHLLITPRDAVPISLWPDRDAAFLDVAQSVRRTVEARRLPATSDAPPPPSAAAPALESPSPTPERALLGRHREMAVVEKILEAEPAEGVRFILIGGESGLGKTALAHYACERARARRFEVQSVVCEPFHEGMSLFPMRELARKLSGALTMREKIGELYGPSSNQVQIAASAEGSSADAASKRDALIASYVNLVFGRFAGGGGQPLLIFVDDLECVDSGTVDTILCLLARGREGNVVVVGAYRTDIVREGGPDGHPLMRILSAVQRQGQHSAVLQLRPLDRRDLPKLCALMLGGQCRLPPEFYRKLFAETEGNPLFIHEVLHSLASTSHSAEPFLRQCEGAWRVVRPVDDWALPATIEDAIRNRLSSLSAAQREELERAAVIGSRFAFDIILRLTSASEAELLERLEAFISLNLIREISGQPDMFAFSHGKIRGVLYSSMSGLRRRRMHMEVAAILRELEAPLGQDWAAMIAEHLYQAGAFADATPLLLRAAREAASLYAMGDAARYFERAIAAAGKSAFPEGESEGRVRLEHAESLRLAFEYEEAEKILGDLVDHPEAEIRGRALNALGDILITRGDVEGALRCYSDCERLARERSDWPLVLEVSADLAELYGRRAEHLAAIDTQAAREAETLYNKYLGEELALVQKHGNSEALGRALRNEAKRLRVQGRLDDALNKYQAAVATEPPGTASHRLMIPYAKALSLARRYDEALAVIDRVLRWSQQIGARRSEGIARQYRGTTLWEKAVCCCDISDPRRHALLEESKDELEEALGAHEEVGFSNGRRETLIALGTWHLTAGSAAEALSLFRTAIGADLTDSALVEAVAAELRTNGDTRRSAYVLRALDPPEL